MCGSVGVNALTAFGDVFNDESALLNPVVRFVAYLNLDTITAGRFSGSGNFARRFTVRTNTFVGRIVREHGLRRFGQVGGWFGPLPSFLLDG